MPNAFEKTTLDNGLRVVTASMPHASSLYPGVLLQSVLGQVHATLLQGRACPQVRLPELDRVELFVGEQALTH